MLIEIILALCPLTNTLHICITSLLSAKNYRTAINIFQLILRKLKMGIKRHVLFILQHKLLIFFFHSWIVFAVTSLKTFCFRFLASRVTQENMNMFILVCILLSKKKFLIDIIFSYLIFYFWQTLQISKENYKSSQLHRILNKYKAFIVKYNPNLFCLSLLCCLF